MHGFDEVPVNRWLGMQLHSATAERVELGLPLRAEFVQEHGVIHGALLALAADTAAVYLIHPTLAPAERMASIEFKVNFLAAAWPQRGPLRAVATIVRRGRRIAVCESAVHQADTELLRGLFTYMVFTST